MGLCQDWVISNFAKTRRSQRGILTELRSLSQTKCPDGHVIPSLQEWQSRQMIHSESSLSADDSEVPFIRILKLICMNNQQTETDKVSCRVSTISVNNFFKYASSTRG